MSYPEYREKYGRTEILRWVSFGLSPGAAGLFLFFIDSTAFIIVRNESCVIGFCNKIVVKYEYLPRYRTGTENYVF